MDSHKTKSYLIKKIPKIILVTDSKRNTGSLFYSIQMAINAGIELIQFRFPKGFSKEIIDNIKTLKKRNKSLFIINDDLKAAIECKAEGLHLKENSVHSVKKVRELFGRNFLIGRSVHSIIAAKKAVKEEIDYLIVGTIFKTTCKPYHQGDGVRKLKKINEFSKVPIFGIGGITRKNLNQVMKQEVHGVAVVTDILKSEDPFTASKEIIELIKKH